MPHSSDGKPAKRKAELRVRMRAMLEDGSLASLGSEGRLVALYVLQVADWTSCQARFSIRRAAETMRVRPNTVHRGIRQMIEAGILEDLGKAGRGFYLVKKRTPLVDSAHTARGRAVHDSCARRTPLVGALSTGCGQDSVLSSGSPVRTSEISSEATGMAGTEPASQRPGKRDCDLPAAS
jgi:hypothetical protein